MATIPIAIIFQCCGMTTASARNRIVSDMMSPPEGLKKINGEALEEIVGAFRDYARCDAVDGKIVFTRVQQRRLISLMDWVKVRTLLEEEVPFLDGTTVQ